MEEKKLTDEAVAKVLSDVFTTVKRLCDDNKHLTKENGELKEERENMQAEIMRLEDMKFTQEHCDLYSENEWLKTEMRKQKAEIERLTKENEGRFHYESYLLNMNDNLNDEIYELQKQVDGLKDELELQKNLYKRAEESGYCTGYKSAVKDKAKEIFENVFEVICCFTTQGKSEEYNEGYIDCLAEVDKRLQNLAKEKHGVEV